MAELTLEALKAEFDLQSKQLETLTEQIAELNTKLAAVKPGATGISVAKPTVEKAKVPTSEFKHEKKTYRFADNASARIRIAGDATVYTAEEVGATAGKKDGLFAKVLAIPGQNILVEVL
jgi:hypothetical protein